MELATVVAVVRPEPPLEPLKEPEPVVQQRAPKPKEEEEPMEIGQPEQAVQPENTGSTSQVQQVCVHFGTVNSCL